MSNYETTLTAVRDLSEHRLTRKPGRYFNPGFKPQPPDIERRKATLSTTLEQIRRDEVEWEKQRAKRKAERREQEARQA